MGNRVGYNDATPGLATWISLLICKRSDENSEPTARKNGNRAKKYKNTLAIYAIKVYFLYQCILLNLTQRKANPI
jgi:hypothetical protein